MSSGNDYNWEMTGPPDASVAWTDPNAAESWNNYVEQKNAESGGAGQQLPSISPEGVFVAPPPSTEPPSWLRPEDYVSNGFAAPYTADQISKKIAEDWVREGYGGVKYASVFGPSDLSGGEYVIDPKTNKFAFDSAGNPIPVPRPNLSGTGFGDVIADKLIPGLILAGAAGTGLGAAGLLGSGTGLVGGVAEGLGLFSNPIVSSALSGAGYGALTGGVTSALTGQDALKGALIGGATGGILGGGEAAFFPGIAEAAQGSVANAGLLGAGRGAVGGALNTAIGGGDLRKNILYGGIGGGALGAGSEYFFPTTPSSAVLGDSKVKYTPGGDMSQEIANMNLMNEYERAYGLNRASNYEMADWVTRLNEIPLEQQRIQMIDEGWDPAAVNVATMPRSEIESYLKEYTTDGPSEIEAYDRARAIEMKYGTTIGEAGEAGINMPLYTDTPLDQQYINQDLTEGHGYYTQTPKNWFSGLGNLGTLLGVGALGRGVGAGGGGAGKAGAAGGSYVPKGMVDYSGILNLLAPKTSTRSSLLG